MTFPRVLVVAMGRINAMDTGNNGLLLRNLFNGWPRENLAQVYSGNDNGDAGFFGSYYPLGPDDRRFGKYFFKLKAGEMQTASSGNATPDAPASPPRLSSHLKTISKRLLLETGLYELIFRPQLSRQLLDWVHAFKPDIIFAQGYNLSFSWLPVLLKQETGARLSLLATDDWPTYLYAGQLGEPKLFSWLLRPQVVEATRQLMAATDVPFAFGQAMTDEYSARYDKPFITLSHADNWQRFDDAVPCRIYDASVYSVVAVGYFNKNRWPLLLDADACCRLLAEQGMHVRIAVLSCGIDPEGERALAGCSHLDLLPDPGNDLLPAYLKGADLLLLAEGFDEAWVTSIRLSVSSKSHLYMFSRRPIVVYAHPDTGVARYASAYGWGLVVKERNAARLAEAIKSILNDGDMANTLIARGDQTANEFHVHGVCQTRFIHALAG